MSGPPFLDAGAVARLLSPRRAVDALEAALREGLDPEQDAPRSSLATGSGELLVMPASTPDALGVKLASVAPGNPGRGLPRIQGIYVLFDPETLAPAALVDGSALTCLRTAAVSALAVRHLAPTDACRLLVFGSGPQAAGHVEALRAVRPLEWVDVVARDRGRVARLIERCRAAGLHARAPGSLRDALGAADIVCCATTAREPLFHGGSVGDDATVVAIGSHEPEAREVDERLVGRSTVVVESRASALREAGDLIQAIAAGASRAESPANLAELVTGRLNLPAQRPRLFKSTGMAWEDAVVAGALWQARAESP